jgi:hypothetical protein
MCRHVCASLRVGAAIHMPVAGAHGLMMALQQGGVFVANIATG